MGKIRFLAHGKTFEADLVVGNSLLQHAKRIMAPEGDACGGVCACSTCHVYVTKGKELLSEADEDEEDIMDKAFDVKMNSRLGCQAVVRRDGDVECEITRESLDAFYNEHPQIPDPRKG